MKKWLSSTKSLKIKTITTKTPHSQTQIPHAGKLRTQDVSTVRLQYLFPGFSEKSKNMVSSPRTRSYMNKHSFIHQTFIKRPSLVVCAKNCYQTLEVR